MSVLRVRRKRCRGLPVLLAATGVLGSLEAMAQSDERPNVVVILMDDLGYGDVSFLNPQSKARTPRMDQLAREGVWLTDAHSPSAICSPTRYAMLTGRYAWRHPKLERGVLMPWDPPVIGEQEATLARRLGQAGYRTACIGKWHLGFTWPWKDGYGRDAARQGGMSIAQNEMFDWSRPIGGGALAAGFDSYFGDDVPNFPPYAYIENRALTCDPVQMRAEDMESIGTRGTIHGDGPGQAGWRFEQVMPTITQAAVDRVAEFAEDGARFFLWFATTSPHTPVVPTEAFQGASDAGFYGDYIVQTDDAIGQVVDALKRHGVFENTLLVVTSDNGPSPLIQDVITEFDHRPAGPLRGMKWDFWEGGHRVPFIASWPAGGLSGGKRIDDLVALHDVYATVLAAGGVEVEDLRDSMNVLSTLRGEAPVRREMVYHQGGGALGLRQGEWALLRGNGGRKEPEWRRELYGIESEDAELQLFNLEADLGQKTNVAEAHPEIAQEMLERLEELARSD